jgi:hypothetical protein
MSLRLAKPSHSRDFATNPGSRGRISVLHSQFPDKGRKLIDRLVQFACRNRLVIVATGCAGRRSHREGRYHHHLGHCRTPRTCFSASTHAAGARIIHQGAGGLTVPCRYHPHPLVGRIPARLCCVRCVDELPLSPAAHDGRAFGRKRSRQIMRYLVLFGFERLLNHPRKEADDVEVLLQRRA